MEQRETGENFKVVVSTKKTLFGAPASDFKVYYAPVDDLGNKTAVIGGATEATITIASGDEHTATTVAASPAKSKILYIDDENSTLQEGDVIEYSTGYYGYILRIVGQKVYLKRRLKVAVASGATITQVGNTGEYVTPDIAIQAAGEYIVTVEAPDYGILAEQRVAVVDPNTAGDPDAPEETVAVAY